MVGVFVAVEVTGRGTASGRSAGSAASRQVVAQYIPLLGRRESGRTAPGGAEDRGGQGVFAARRAGYNRRR